MWTTQAERVGDADRPPFDAVGLLATEFNDGSQGFGSASLVGPRLALTCAHNLTGQGHGSPFADEARLYPRWNRPEEPSRGGVRAANGFFPSPFRDGDTSWDVALLVLAADAPRPHAYFRPWVSSDDSICGREVSLAGYPDSTGFEMWWARDTVAKVDVGENVLLFTHDTGAGASGAPIYDYDGETLWVFGVHNAVVRATGLRRGLLITEAVGSWLNAAARQPLDPDRFAIALDV